MSSNTVVSGRLTLRRAGKREQAAEVTVARCANCAVPLSGPDAAVRAPDTAWHLQCAACHELAQESLELIEDRPDGSNIQVYQCRRCGGLRSCRPGWHTRCHICLDERSSESWLEGSRLACLDLFSQDPMLGLRVGRNLNVNRGQPITARAIIEATSVLTVATRLASFERSGWTVLATDIWGLPWHGIRSRPESHGTWGRHDACGAVTKLRTGSVDCPSCGPQPGSRTHRARRDDPYLLYLVTIKGLTKFGVGNPDRVRTHLRGGASVVQVLRAPFAEVVLAEQKLKTAHAAAIFGRRTRKMPQSFGLGTEVVSRRIPVDLAEVLPSGEDVTSSYAHMPG
jgi:hypothetical protein